AATYYWRVRAKDQLGLWSPYSAVATFVVDATSPTLSSFFSINSTLGQVDEISANDMTSGATVQVSARDLTSGLNEAAPSFSVLYSTNAGASWIDLSSNAATLVGTGETTIPALASFGGRLFAGSGPNAKLYAT